MSDDAEEPEEETPKKGSKMPLIIGLVLLLAGGGGGFFAVQSGLLGGGSESHAEAEVAEENDAPLELNVSFVPIDPLVISLPGTGGRGHLRFVAQLEVPPDHVAEVEAVKPRIVDVLNGYLRAVDLTDLENPAALMRLRSQMLRRVQVVTGEGRVSDLLIMEFVLS
ncbi:flagellar basal body-associated protein FliL [Loktanella agnita]|uniref:flagellar basal body-associated FliL family protein n=1 Tax=Loktanella agnita TaxID=287097 RepID=UPI0039887ABE